MIPGDLGAEIAVALRDAVAAGEIAVAGEIDELAGAMAATAAGTWRPAPGTAGGGAGTYASSVAFRLASVTGTGPGRLAGLLAARLGAVPWVTRAQVTGAGYLTVTVAPERLAGLAARVVAAGPGLAARSDALAGLHRAAPALPDLAAARSWQQAWRGHHDALCGRLERAAGAEVHTADAQRLASAAAATGAGRGAVAAALAYHGADAVRYALAKAATGDAGPIRRQLSVPLDLDNPFVAVRYAHAEAAGTLRRAGELRLAAAAHQEAAGAGTRGRAPGDTAGLRRASEPRPSRPAPPELAVLDALSWLPERVAAAARLRRPAELTAALEHIAASWLECARICPPLPFGGRAAPADPGGPLAAARCGLADAVRVALAGGLALLAVTAPARV